MERDNNSLAAELEAYLKTGGENEETLAKLFAEEDAANPPPPEEDDKPEPKPQQQPAKAAEQAKEPSKQPGAEEDEDDGGDGWERGADGRFKSVPYHALHKTREKMKRAIAEASELREKFARGDERLQILTKALQGADGGKAEAKPGGGDKPKSAFDEADIDPNEDLFAALDQQKRRNLELRQERQKDGEERQTREQAEALSNRWKADAEQQIKGDGEKARALVHWMQTRDAELQALGITDAAKRAAHIRSEHHEIASRAYAANSNPFDVIERLAAARGWKRGEGTTSEQDQTPGKESGKTAETQQQQPKESKIAAIKKAQETNTSLNHAGGSGGSGLTLAQLADMPQDEVNKLMSGLSTKQKVELLNRIS